jgi:hypothetical protein
MKRILIALAVCAGALGFAAAADAHGPAYHNGPHYARYGIRCQGGYYYPRHCAPRWTYKCWVPTANCYYYWEPDLRCYYYYDTTRCCYCPVTAGVVMPPPVAPGVGVPPSPGTPGLGVPYP